MLLEFRVSRITRFFHLNSKLYLFIFIILWTKREKYILFLQSVRQKDGMLVSQLGVWYLMVMSIYIIYIVFRRHVSFHIYLSFTV
jgi:hypothetical protein